jgi:hypothetical protein
MITIKRQIQIGYQYHSKHHHHHGESGYALLMQYHYLH